MIVIRTIVLIFNSNNQFQKYIMSLVISPFDNKIQFRWALLHPQFFMHAFVGKLIFIFSEALLR